jgi:hypothetical protein
MALQKGIIPVGYQGLQGIIDDKTAPIGTYVTVDNLIMSTNHELIKRDGMASIGASTFPSNIYTMYSFNNELGVITDSALWSYSASLDKFRNMGSVSAPIVTAQPVIANTYTQTVVDGDNNTNGIQAIAWEDSRGGVYATVKDLNSNSYLIDDTQISATGVRPKVVSIDKYILVFYVETTTLKVIRYDIVNNVVSAASTVSSILNTNLNYDVIGINNGFLPPFVAIVVGETTPQIRLYGWNVRKNIMASVADNIIDPIVLTSTNVENAMTALTITTNPLQGYFVIGWYNGSDKIVRIQTFTLGGISVNASNLAVGSATTDAGYSVGISIDNLNKGIVVYSSKSTNSTVFQATITNFIATTTPTLTTSGTAFYYNTGLVSKPFLYNSLHYYAVGYDSSLQGTYFLVRNDGLISSRMMAQVAGGNPAKTNSLTKFAININKENTYTAPILRVTKISASSGGYSSTTSIYSEQVFFTPYSIDNKSVGRVLNVAGGFVKNYDGNENVVEQGFHLYPESISTNATGVGVIPAGSYSYKAHWEWTDNNGQIVRSQTSTPIAVTVGAVTHNVVLTFKNLPFTAKQSRFNYVRTPPVLAVYRTAVNGTTYFRLNQSVSEYVYNTTTSDTVTYTDNKLDASIISNSVLYTTGGVFDNVATPSANLLTLLKNRVIISGLDIDPNVIYFSKEKESGVGVEFSNELSLTIDSLGGDITALAAMDDKILIFKKSLIYFVSGQGADKLGNGSFTIPQLVSSDTGTSNPQSIVLMSDGIMFQSPKGIYLVDRQLNVTYIGNPVKDYESYTITSAANLPDNNRVHLTTVEGFTLVYHTFFKSWTTFSNLKYKASISNQSVWYGAGDSGVFRATAGQTFDDGNAAIISTLKTSWISISGIEGFQRIYSIVFVGDNQLATDTLKMNLYYDFKAYSRQSLTITPANNETTTLYGEDSPYGTGTPYGGSNDQTAQYMARPLQQKCTAIQIELKDDFPSGNRPAGFKFSELMLVVGVKQGYNKNLSTTKRRFV